MFRLPLAKTFLPTPRRHILPRSLPRTFATYDPAVTEPKWQHYWSSNATFKTPLRTASSTKPKKYILDMFPYPSGSGLHVGHPEGYTATDVMARYYRTLGYDVLHPMGWDSFGLPAEQHAINTGTRPEVTTFENIKTFKRQLKSLGFSYDWDRELATTDTVYVKWTQYIFLQLYSRQLAAQSEVSVNWCPELGTVLANEEVINGLSERGDFPVVRMPLRQWVLKIPEYSDRLMDGLEGLDWPSGTMSAQKQWIGKSTGCTVGFSLPQDDAVIDVFTTRVDTLLGVTYVTLAPEHPLVQKLTADEHKESVEEYVRVTSSRSDMDRTAAKEKTGVFTGSFCTHPITGLSIPVWVGDYVLGSYGSGAVMAVPAHDVRDYEFAEKFGLPIKTVVKPTKGEAEDSVAFTKPGVLVDSEQFTGLSTAEAQTAIAALLSEKSLGGPKIQYKLRDWVFSRQRYWGEPIPIYFPIDNPGDVDPRTADPAQFTIRYDSPIPVDVADLPLTLPEMDDFSPGDDPAGCLARATDWRYFEKDGKWFARETNTMPQWAGSCWYYLRYIDPTNDAAPFSADADKAWMPVDLYVGGAEHAVLHLLYARFWHQVLFDIGLTSHPEPFKKLVHQGMILGSDGEKMSKSRGNVVNPDDIVSDTGADSLRLYEMFMGPIDAVKPWQTSQVQGVVRFMRRAWTVCEDTVEKEREGEEAPETVKLLHQTMKKVTEDIEAMSFNTAISAMMVLANHMNGVEGGVKKESVEKLAIMLCPFAPHIAEEMWEKLGHSDTLAYEPWVEFDESLCVETSVVMGVQVNGKVRGEISINKSEEDESVAMELALAVDKVKEFVDKGEIKKIIFRPGRILNLIVK